jgi:hypothetical protein
MSNLFNEQHHHQRYNVPSKLKFVFPSQVNKRNENIKKLGKIEYENENENLDLIKKNENLNKSFIISELILLEMYYLLKSSFSRTNTQPYIPSTDTPLKITDLENTKNLEKDSTMFSFMQNLINKRKTEENCNKDTGGNFLDGIEEDISSDLNMGDLLTLLKVSNRYIYVYRFMYVRRVMYI